MKKKGILGWQPRMRFSQRLEDFFHLWKAMVRMEKVRPKIWTPKKLVVVIKMVDFSSHGIWIRKKSPWKNKNSGWFPLSLLPLQRGATLKFLTLHRFPPTSFAQQKTATLAAKLPGCQGSNCPFTKGFISYGSDIPLLGKKTQVPGTKGLTLVSGLFGYKERWTKDLPSLRI